MIGKFFDQAAIQSPINKIREVFGGKNQPAKNPNVAVSQAQSNPAFQVNLSSSDRPETPEEILDDITSHI